jgi:hypothetical protein
MGFAQWINDLRWGANMRRARAWRRELSFSKREAFDAALRPRLPRPYPDERSDIIAYPDALYHIGIDDLCRAMLASAGPTAPPEGGK